MKQIYNKLAHSELAHNKLAHSEHVYKKELTNIFTYIFTYIYKYTNTNKYMNIMMYSISLIERPNRFLNARLQFKKIPIITNFINYKLVNKHKNGGRYGCFDSHIQCILSAYSNPNIDYVLIWEDDFEFIISDYDINKKFNDFLLYLLENKHNPNIDIIYSQERSYVFLTNPIETNKIYNGKMYGGTFYALNRNIMKKIIDEYHDYIGNYHIDTFYQKYNNSVIFINPLVGILPFGSDNDSWSLDFQNPLFKIGAIITQYLTNYSNIVEKITFNISKNICIWYIFLSNCVLYLINIIILLCYKNNIILIK